MLGGRVDQSALDLELRDALNRVVLPVGESRRRPGLPVRRPDHERAEQDDGDDGEPGQLPVHSARSRLARFETSINPASTRKFATTLEPP